VNTVTRLHPERQAEPARAALAPHSATDLDQAELFLLSLDGEVNGADLPRMAYLLGLAEGHLANLTELVRSLTR
jgi:hypothetical protein